MSQLDAVSEVDSQIGATPMNMITNEKMGMPRRLNTVEQPLTPRENQASQFEPAKMLHHGQTMTMQPNKAKAQDLQNQFASPMIVRQPATTEPSDSDFD